MARLLTTVLAVLAAWIPCYGQESFDLIVRNGRVVDGTGRPAFMAEVAVRDGRIVRVGNVAGTASRTIDARGMIVAPGFIDLHTHADDIWETPRAENFVRMGVTSIVAGNCGGSALPVSPALGKVRAAGASVNFATLVGHNTVRRAVMNTARRAPTTEELARMKELVARAMGEGAVGLSSGLQYVPGTYAAPEEVIELAKEAARYGGVYASHMRNEGTDIENAVAEAIRVGELASCPVQISHLKIDSPSRWGASAKVLSMIGAARKRGVEVHADQYAYSAGSSGLSIRFPSWALEGGQDAIRRRLDDPAMWERIRSEILGLLEERGFHDLAWAAIASYRADTSLEGLDMKTAAIKLRGDGSSETQLELARQMMRNGGASMVYHFMSEDDIRRFMRHPQVSIASDSSVLEFGKGVPHPRGYGNNARVLAHYVRENNTISLEEAVRKMTSLPAAQFGFENRGILREGFAADLVVFDPATVQDTATYADPHQYPEGIPYVIVNGVPVVDQGEHSGARPGQMLRRAGRRRN